MMQYAVFSGDNYSESTEEPAVLFLEDEAFSDYHNHVFDTLQEAGEYAFKFVGRYDDIEFEVNKKYFGVTETDYVIIKEVC